MPRVRTMGSGTTTVVSEERVLNPDIDEPRDLQ